MILFNKYNTLPSQDICITGKYDVKNIEELYTMILKRYSCKITLMSYIYVDHGPIGVREYDIIIFPQHIVKLIRQIINKCIKCYYIESTYKNKKRNFEVFEHDEYINDRLWSANSMKAVHYKKNIKCHYLSSFDSMLYIDTLYEYYTKNWYCSLSNIYYIFDKIYNYLPNKKRLLIYISMFLSIERDNNNIYFRDTYNSAYLIMKKYNIIDTKVIQNYLKSYLYKIQRYENNKSTIAKLKQYIFNSIDIEKYIIVNNGDILNLILVDTFCYDVYEVYIALLILKIKKSKIISVIYPNIFDKYEKLLDEKIEQYKILIKLYMKHHELHMYDGFGTYGIPKTALFGNKIGTYRNNQGMLEKYRNVLNKSIDDRKVVVRTKINNILLNNLWIDKSIYNRGSTHKYNKIRNKLKLIKLYKNMIDI